MKTCEFCLSTTFDDMEMCYDCLSSFAEPLPDEASELEQSVARLRIVLAGYFSYEMLLSKLEGRSLSVGSSSENAIVIPQEQVAAHQLQVFYAHGHIWVESVDSALHTTIGEEQLLGTVCVGKGSEIKVGDALITVLED